MASFNNVVIMGNITRDIELRYITSGTAVTDIGLAVNEKRKDGNGGYIDEVSFIDVTLWGQTAEVANEYLGKGKSVLIHGRLKQDRWEKDGQKHSKIKVICEKLVMVGSGQGNQSQNQNSQQDEPEENYQGGYDNEIPF